MAAAAAAAATARTIGVDGNAGPAGAGGEVTVTDTVGAAGVLGADRGTAAAGGGALG
jgi:hypothetical protein